MPEQNGSDEAFRQLVFVATFYHDSKIHKHIFHPGLDRGQGFPGQKVELVNVDRDVDDGVRRRLCPGHVDSPPKEHRLAVVGLDGRAERPRESQVPHFPDDLEARGPCMVIWRSLQEAHEASEGIARGLAVHERGRRLGLEREVPHDVHGLAVVLGPHLRRVQRHLRVENDELGHQRVRTLHIPVRQGHVASHVVPLRAGAKEIHPEALVERRLAGAFAFLLAV
mmetsp:Transcript_14823/g.56079  ORF Transcript_14823/g.56079 Transcript_14823/m.56079 type:complete len:224 (+) Transcript_14823:1363-2034(+)